MAEANGEIASVMRIAYKQINGLRSCRSAPEDPDRAARRAPKTFSPASTSAWHKSPVRDGFLQRQHFADAAPALWLEGEFVHTEDLVLHDAHMDIRTPTHELTRAHAVLRARRRIFLHPPDWALSRVGLLVLRGREGQGGRRVGAWTARLGTRCRDGRPRGGRRSRRKPC